MKKFFVALLAFALVAGNLFAEVSFGAWGRGVFVPFRTYIIGNDDSKNTSTAATEVGWGALPNFAFQFSISGENIGLISNFDFATPGRDGNLYTWWRPNDLFKLDIGYVRWDVLRGISVAESFQNDKYTGSNPAHEDFIFHRFATADWWSTNPGAVLEITPVANLYIGAAINTGAYTNSKDDTLEDIYKNSQYAIGYNIDGIGLIRAGYFGKNSQGIGNQLVQGAFKVTAVEGLVLDIGVGYGLDQDGRDNKNNLTVGLAATYGTDVFGVGATVGAWLGGDGDAGGDYPKVEVVLNPYVPLSFATVGLGVDFGLALGQENSTHIGFDVYIQKGFGGGQIKAGVAADIQPGAPDPAKQNVVIAIPIEITYSVW
jgi:hypothetical protein